MCEGVKAELSFAQLKKRGKKGSSKPVKLPIVKTRGGGKFASANSKRGHDRAAGAVWMPQHAPYAPGNKTSNKKQNEKRKDRRHNHQKVRRPYPCLFTSISEWQPEVDFELIPVACRAPLSQCASDGHLSAP